MTKLTWLFVLVSVSGGCAKEIELPEVQLVKISSAYFAEDELPVVEFSLHNTTNEKICVAKYLFDDSAHLPIFELSHSTGKVIKPGKKPRGRSVYNDDHKVQFNPNDRQASTIEVRSISQDRLLNGDNLMVQLKLWSRRCDDYSDGSRYILTSNKYPISR